MERGRAWSCCSNQAVAKEHNIVQYSEVQDNDYTLCGNGDNPQRVQPDWSTQLSAIVTIQWLQCDWTPPLFVKGVACDANEYIPNLGR